MENQSGGIRMGKSIGKQIITKTNYTEKISGGVRMNESGGKKTTNTEN
jgi:hypothetical protein